MKEIVDFTKETHLIFHKIPLRNELLKKSKLGNGTFEPKNLKKEKVKEVLLSFSYDYNNSKNLEKSI